MDGTRLLPNDLNSFFSRFEKDNGTKLESIISSLRPDDSVLTINASEVMRALKRTKKNTTPGPMTTSVGRPYGTVLSSWEVCASICSRAL